MLVQGKIDRARMIFGLALMAMPGFGALVLLWIIGVWAVAFGILFVMLGLRLRKL